MAWTAPVAATVGQVLAATFWNAQVYGNARYLKGLDGQVQIDNDLFVVGHGRFANAKNLYWLNAAATAWLRTLDVDSGPNLNIARDDNIGAIQTFGDVIFFDGAASPLQVGRLRGSDGGFALAAAGSVGTTMPASPMDGQVFAYSADATNGIIWYFRYRSSVSRWEFIGGPPLFSTVVTYEQVLSGTYADAPTPGPSLTVPLSGDYYVDISAKGRTEHSSAQDAHILMSYQIGATAAVDADAADAWSTGDQGSQIERYVKRMTRKTLTAGTVLTMKYRRGGGQGNTGSWQNREMRLIPIRLT